MTPARGQGPAALSAGGVWKVFGSKPEHAVRLARDGHSRSEVLEQTGCTIGVRDVSFDVAEGETFVVMGLSGSGKSTLIRCLSRLADLTEGTVHLGGDDLTALDDDGLREIRRRKLSMVFQHFGLFPHRTVVDNAAYGLEVQGMDRTQRRDQAYEVLEVVGLKGFEEHYPQQLSGGMQQRVGLARALAVDPEVLFFDEPFSALDPLIRRDMQDELIRLQTEMQRTIVFITHDFAEAIKLGDRIAIMKDGVFEQIGTASELIANPATDYVAEFTKDIPKVKVLTAAGVMRPFTGDEGNGGDSGAEAAKGEPADGVTARTVSADCSIEDALPLLLADAAPLTVVDADQRAIGSLEHSTVARLLGAGS